MTANDVRTTAFILLCILILIFAIIAIVKRRKIISEKIKNVLSIKPSLGFYILISSIILAGSIVYLGNCGRYKLVINNNGIRFVIDSLTGDTYNVQNGKLNKLGEQ